jgi:hypothetical protein
MDAGARARRGQDALQRLTMHQPLLLLGLTLALAAIALVVWDGKRDSVAPVFTVTWVIHLLLWCAIPLVLQQFLTEPVVNADGPWSRDQLVALHSATLLVLVLAHLAFRHPYIGDIKTFFDRHAPAPDRLFWPTAVSLFLLAGVEVALSRVTGTSFADVVAFSVAADAGSQAQSGVLSVLLSFLLGYAIALISVGRSGGISRGTLVLAWLGTMLFSGFSIARGSRAVVLLPMAVGLIALTTLHGRARRRATTLVVVVGILTIVVGAPTAAMMGYARGGYGSISLELVQEAYTVVMGAQSLGDRLQIGAQEVNRKFDAIGPGIELLAMEPPGTGGLAPLLSATVSPIPRMLYPSKPVPTSRDGTYLGSPYRIAAKAYGDPEIGMVVPVSASAIGLWEFGTLGPLILVLSNLIGLLLLNTALVSRNVLLRAIGISFLNLPNAEFFIAPPSTVVQNGLRFLLYVGVLAVMTLSLRMLMKPNVDDAAVVPA